MKSYKQALNLTTVAGLAAGIVFCFFRRQQIRAAAKTRLKKLQSNPLFNDAILGGEILDVYDERSIC